MVTMVTDHMTTIGTEIGLMTEIEIIIEIETTDMEEEITGNRLFVKCKMYLNIESATTCNCIL